MGEYMYHPYIMGASTTIDSNMIIFLLKQTQSK